MALKPTLPLSRQIASAVGRLGWSTLIDVVGLALVYFYLPPDSRAEDSA